MDLLCSRCLLFFATISSIPSEVGGLQVVFQGLRVGVLGGALDQTLAHRVDVLQPGLHAVHLLPLEALEGDTEHNKAARLDPPHVT